MVVSLDWLRQTCLVPSLKLARQLQKTKPRERRVRQNALQRVLARLFLRVGCSLFYIVGFCHISGSFTVLFLGDAETILRVSGNEELSTGVETDGQLRGRHIVVTRSLVPLVGRSQHDVSEAVHSRGRSRELLERAFDDGNSCARMRNLLVLFQVGSKFFTMFLSFPDQFVTDPAATMIRATGHQMVSLCRSVCEEEKAQLLSPLMNS